MDKPTDEPMDPQTVITVSVKASELSKHGLSIGKLGRTVNKQCCKCLSDVIATYESLLRMTAPDAVGRPHAYMCLECYLADSPEKHGFLMPSDASLKKELEALIRRGAVPEDTPLSKYKSFVQEHGAMWYKAIATAMLSSTNKGDQASQ